MKHLKPVWAALVAATAIVTGQPAPAAGVDLQTGAVPTALALNHGEKWSTDQKLRQYMGEIRRLLVAARRSMADGKMAGPDYRRLGAAIEQNVQFIFANCELEPSADANLHIVIGELLGSVATLKGESPSKSKAAIASAIAAANRYGEVFNHPGWQRIL